LGPKLDYSTTDSNGLGLKFEEKITGRYMLDSSKLQTSHVDVRLNLVKIYSVLKAFNIFSDKAGKSEHSFMEFDQVQNFELPIPYKYDNIMLSQ